MKMTGARNILPISHCHSFVQSWLKNLTHLLLIECSDHHLHYWYIDLQVGLLPLAYRSPSMHLSRKCFKGHCSWLQVLAIIYFSTCIVEPSVAPRLCP